MKDTTLSWQWHGTRWPCMSNIFIIASMNILAGRSTKTLRRVLFFVMHREMIHWMWRTNANTFEGRQGAQWARMISTGLYDKETVAGRDVLFWGANHTELSNRAGSGGLSRFPNLGQPNSNSASFWSSRSTSRAHVLFDARPGRSRRRVLSAPRTKCSLATATTMLSASWCVV